MCICIRMYVFVYIRVMSGWSDETYPHACITCHRSCIPESVYMVSRPHCSLVWINVSLFSLNIQQFSDFSFILSITKQYIKWGPHYHICVYRPQLCYIVLSPTDTTAAVLKYFNLKRLVDQIGRVHKLQCPLYCAFVPDSFCYHIPWYTYFNFGDLHWKLSLLGPVFIWRPSVWKFPLLRFDGHDTVLFNYGDSNTGKAVSLYWDRTLVLSWACLINEIFLFFYAQQCISAYKIVYHIN